MDDLTRERFGADIPWVEKRRVMLVGDPRVIAERRRILCGFDEPDPAETLAALERDRRLTDAIRRGAA